jgi:hypothetical protein
MCHTTSDSDCIAFAKNFTHAVVILMAAIAVDYPIMRGTCTNTNNFLFCGNKNNVINHRLSFLLDCRWFQSKCDRCIHMKNTGIKMVVKVLYDIYYINNTLQKNIKTGEKIPDITFSAGQREIK